MKKIIALFLLGFAAINSQAQTKAEKTVAVKVEQLRKAMVDADSITLNKLTASKLSYGHSSGAVDDKQIFVEKILSGKSDFVTLEFNDQAITINKHVAIVRHKLDAKTNDNGKPGEVHLKVMLVWQKQHGYWKLLARQAVKIP